MLLKRNEPERLGGIPSGVMDMAQKIFIAALVITLAIYAYLIYGLVTGSLANVPNMPKLDQFRVQNTVENANLYMNISLVVTLVSAIVCFWESEAIGVIMLLIAAFLAYGLQFLIEYLVEGTTGQRVTGGHISELAFGQIKSTSLMIAVPGILMFGKAIYERITAVISGRDLTQIQFGKNAVKETRYDRVAIPALAKCWQMAYCREGIRKQCPIFHAQSKCWKEGVGCMCEENVIRLSMAGGIEQKPVDMTKDAGFVPIGDIITKSEKEHQQHIPTRIGPRGVRIPTNPHLSAAQKKERCNNCVIYNEHQRRKFQLLAPIVTVSIPAFVALNFDMAKNVVNSAMLWLDGFITHINLTPTEGKPVSDIAQKVNGSLPISVILVVCLTLVVLTWALRLLEYSIFKQYLRQT